MKMSFFWDVSLYSWAECYRYDATSQNKADFSIKTKSSILIIKQTRCTNFSNLFFEQNHMFQTARLSIIRSFSLYTQQR